MTETTYDYINIDARWDARRPPFADAAAVISAWTSDEDLDTRADALATSCGTDADDLHDLLHAVRSHLRAAALADEKALSQANAVMAKMDHLVTGDTTDEQLRAYAAAAEAGAGGSVDGVREDLTVVRTGKRADRLFVSGPGTAPRVANFGDPASRTT